MSSPIAYRAEALAHHRKGAVFGRVIGGLPRAGVATATSTAALLAFGCGFAALLPLADHATGRASVAAEGLEVVFPEALCSSLPPGSAMHVDVGGVPFDVTARSVDRRGGACVARADDVDRGRLASLDGRRGSASVVTHRRTLAERLFEAARK